MIAAREPVPLARGALLIAQEEYPDLDIDAHLDKLAALAREAEPIVRAGEDTVAGGAQAHPATKASATAARSGPRRGLIPRGSLFPSCR